MLDFSKLDLSTVLFINSAQPIFTKRYEYTKRVETINPSIMYMFKDYDSFKAYFNKYGVYDEKTINEVDRINDSSGVILTYKLFCDTTILYYKKMQEFQNGKTKRKMLKQALKNYSENN